MNGKRALSGFVNHICGVYVRDVGCAKGQCECLLGAIIVSVFFILQTLCIYFLLNCICCLNCLEWR